MTLVRYNLRCHRSTSWPFKVFEIRAWKVLATFEATWKPRWMPLWTLQMRFAFLGVNKGQWKTSQGYPTMCILPLPTRPNDTRSWGQWERGWLKKSARGACAKEASKTAHDPRTVGAFVLLTYVIISIYSNMFDTFIIVMLCPDSSTHCLQSLWIIQTVFAQDESLTAPGHIFRSSIQLTVSWFVVFHCILRFHRMIG